MAVLTDEMLMTIKFGTAFDGSAPTFTGTSIDVMLTMQDFEVSDSVQMTDTRGAGVKRAKNRPHGGQATLRLRNAVRMAGYMAKTLGGASPVGGWAQVTLKPLSTLATPDVYTGVIETWRHSGERGNMQLEEFSLNLDMDSGANA